MLQQLFKPGVQRDKNGLLSEISALLAGRHDFVKTIQNEGQVFALHKELIDLKQLIIGKLFRRTGNDQAIQAGGNAFVL